jgi:hypothetical protein
MIIPQHLLDDSPLTPEQKLKAIRDVLVVFTKWQARLRDEEQHVLGELLDFRLTEHGSDADDVVFDKGGFWSHAQSYHEYTAIPGGQLYLEELVNDFHDMQEKFMQDDDMRMLEETGV